MSKLLTPLELKVMNILWKLKEAFVKEILEKWPDDDKPAYNTVSTTVRILQEKGYIYHKAYGRTHQYFPKISKLEYQKRHIQNVVENVFGGSSINLVSALLGTEKGVSNDEIQEIKDLIDNSDEN